MTRKHLQENFVDKKTGLPHFTEDDWEFEVTYQFIYRMMYQWNESERKLGGRLFESVEQVRDLIEISEANRILRAYNKYVADEHPADEDAVGKTEGVDQENFRGA